MILIFVNIFSVCLFLVLLPVSNTESTPSILEVDFFNLLASIKENAYLNVVIVTDADC